MLGTRFTLCVFSLSCFLAWASPGFPNTSPLSQRLLVTQELPFEKVTMVLRQWFVQKGQGALDSCV